MAMTVKMVPIATMTSTSINEKPLERPRSFLLALLAELFCNGRIGSTLLICLYSGWRLDLACFK
jgi:hypothetical protein